MIFEIPGGTYSTELLPSQQGNMARTALWISYKAVGKDLGLKNLQATNRREILNILGKRAPLGKIAQESADHKFSNLFHPLYQKSASVRKSVYSRILREHFHTEIEDITRNKTPLNIEKGRALWKILTDALGEAREQGLVWLHYLEIMIEIIEKGAWRGSLESQMSDVLRGKITDEGETQDSKPFWDIFTQTAGQDVGNQELELHKLLKAIMAEGEKLGTWIIEPQTDTLSSGNRDKMILYQAMTKEEYDIISNMSDNDIFDILTSGSKGIYRMKKGKDLIMSSIRFWCKELYSNGDLGHKEAQKISGISPEVLPIKTGDSFIVSLIVELQKWIHKPKEQKTPRTKSTKKDCKVTDNTPILTKEIYQEEYLLATQMSDYDIFTVLAQKNTFHRILGVGRHVIVFSVRFWLDELYNNPTVALEEANKISQEHDDLLPINSSVFLIEELLEEIRKRRTIQS